MKWHVRVWPTVALAFLLQMEKALADVIELQCRPTLSHFCRNIHIACAGKTRIPTAGFTIEIQRADAIVRFENSGSPIVGKAYRDGDLVITYEHSRDWVRVDPAGRYSHRIYRDGGAAMSHGTCRKLDLDQDGE